MHTYQGKYSGFSQLGPLRPQLSVEITWDPDVGFKCHSYTFHSVCRETSVSRREGERVKDLAWTLPPWNRAQKQRQSSMFQILLPELRKPLPLRFPRTKETLTSREGSRSSLPPGTGSLSGTLLMTYELLTVLPMSELKFMFWLIGRRENFRVRMWKFFFFPHWRSLQASLFPLPGQSCGEPAKHEQCYLLLLQVCFLLMALLVFITDDTKSISKQNTNPTYYSCWELAE